MSSCRSLQFCLVGAIFPALEDKQPPALVSVKTLIVDGATLVVAAFQCERHTHKGACTKPRPSSAELYSDLLVAHLRIAVFCIVQPGWSRLRYQHPVELFRIAKIIIDFVINKFVHEFLQRK